MKHPLFILRGNFVIRKIPLLFAALSVAGNLQSQSIEYQGSKETIIKELQSPKAQRAEVGADDQILLKKALDSPDFAMRIDEWSGRIYVMMHGISHRNIPGFTYRDKPVELIDKADLPGLNPKTFFIVNGFQRTETSAFIDMELQYQFDGTYNNFIRAEILLTKSNGMWTNLSSNPKTIR